MKERHNAIRRAAKKGKYYNRIREIAINDKLAGAVIALAVFKRFEDVDIIIQTKVTGELYTDRPLAVTFFAISKFPHPKFLPFLKSNLDSVINKPPYLESLLLYEAISNYNNKEASALLGRVFQIEDNELRLKHLEELSLALRRNPNPFYNDLRKKIAVEVKN